MVSEKINTLVSRLKALSLSGKVAWKKGIGPNAYQADFPDFSFKIEKLGELLPIYSLTIYDENGNIVEKINDKESDFLNALTSSLHGALKDLHEAASRAADRKIESILSSLEKL